MERSQKDMEQSKKFRVLMWQTKNNLHKEKKIAEDIKKGKKIFRKSTIDNRTRVTEFNRSSQNVI